MGRPITYDSEDARMLCTACPFPCHHEGWGAYADNCADRGEPIPDDEAVGPGNDYDPEYDAGPSWREWGEMRDAAEEMADARASRPGGRGWTAIGY